MRGRYLNVLAVIAVAAIGITACEPADDRADAPPAAEDRITNAQEPAHVPEGATAEMVAQGRQLFTSQGGCHACHGPEARGTQLAPDMTDGEWINVTDPNMETVSQLIRTGVPTPVRYPAPMPAMGGANLSDDQVRALAAYVLSINRS